MGKKELLDNLSRKGFPAHLIEAFKKVKREAFVPCSHKKFAYEDNALSIGEGQTISQPYTIAFMLALMELEGIRNKDVKILEIGSGSGYVLALLASILKKARIFGLEINKVLAKSSSKLLSDNKRIKIINQSGEKGYPKAALFDRILISASADSLDSLEAIIQQLSPHGILVCPVQHSIYQIKRKDEDISKKEFYGFSFVPFIRK